MTGGEGGQRYMQLNDTVMSAPPPKLDGKGGSQIRKLLKQQIKKIKFTFQSPLTMLTLIVIA